MNDAPTERSNTEPWLARNGISEIVALSCMVALLAILAKAIQNAIIALSTSIPLALVVIRMGSQHAYHTLLKPLADLTLGDIIASRLPILELAFILFVVLSVKTAAELLTLNLGSPLVAARRKLLMALDDYDYWWK